MIFEILTSKEVKDNTCYFCAAPLKKYIESLNYDFMDYNIQRGIITNVYLDNLVDTVLKKGYIPPITLVINRYEKESNAINVQEYKILDGLQRTYRLKVIWDTLNYIEEKVLKDIEEVVDLSKSQISRKYGKELRVLNSNTFILEKLLKRINEVGIEVVKNYFDVIQWFEIWDNLSPEEEVEKMLILNAGHKPVSLKHQLELVFLNIIPHIEKIKKETESSLELLREKEGYSKQKRKIGQLYFSHLISSALSFINEAPITTNTNLISKVQEDSLDYKDFLNYEFLEALTLFLVELDNHLYSIYGEEGLQWISRETVSVGLFGALGKYAILNSNREEFYAKNIFDEFIKSLEVAKESGIDLLKINEYNVQRANLDLSKVNVGDVTKKAVYRGIFQLAKTNFTEAIDWEPCFRGDKDGK